MYFTGMTLKFIAICMSFQYIRCNKTISCTNISITAQGTKKYLDQLFKKYGSKDDNFESIKASKFEKFLAAISLGRIKVECEDDDPECLESSHESEISKQRERRSTDLDAYNTTNHISHWEFHMKTCLNAKDILKNHGFKNATSINKNQFMQICPSLVQQIDSKLCVHYHRKFREPEGVPSRTKVWMYGILSITIISLLSLAVITMIPCLKKSYFHKLMAYLVALAVGTLAGDAMLHLIPHAFAEGANAALGTEVSEEEELKQHYSQVWRALFVLLGMYLFFFVEQMMKWRSACRNDHGHNHGDESDGTLLEGMSSSPPPPEDGKVVFHNSGENDEKADLQIKDMSHNHGHGADGHGHSHGDKNITKDTKISSVAWMVIVGDGFHNFSDGLAVGVAYSASLSSGLSTTIAVFCHELPHELGDFAVLINSGMSIKQAIVYNLVSAVLAYLGLIVGILIGGYEAARHFILSITAGLFLYVSLASMLPELSRQPIPRNSRCSSYICQHLGILSGIALMLLISLFEHAM